MSVITSRFDTAQKRQKEWVTYLLLRLAQRAPLLSSVDLGRRHILEVSAGAALLAEQQEG